MRLEELSRGMIFRDNDKRQDGRLIVITDVDRTSGVICFSEYNHDKPLGERRLTSRKPERFHAEEKSSGYTFAGKDL